MSSISSGQPERQRDADGTCKNETSARRRLHRLSEVRQCQGISLRTIARTMDVELSKVRDQENEDADLTLSQLYQWQKLLNVPVAELLVDLDQPVSAPVLQRAQLVRMMKTAMTLRQRVGHESQKDMVGMIIEQLLEIMPELEEVGPWRGTESDASSTGRSGIYTVPDDSLFAE